MLVITKAPVAAALPCQDYERAKAWYKEHIGVSPTEERPGGAFYECGEGTRFFLYPSAGKPSGDHTQASFWVDDVAAEVDELTKTGVKFVQYDFPVFKTDERGIAELGAGRGAWFHDSEGNMLAVFQYDG